jgi:hypothetical protein
MLRMLGNVDGCLDVMWRVVEVAFGWRSEELAASGATYHESLSWV